MENVHAERSAGWSVLAYVAVLLLSTILQQNAGLPSIDTKPLDAAPAIYPHRFTVLWAAWLSFPASGFFLWFLVGLRNYLRYAPGRQEGLPNFAFAAGIVMIAGSLWAGMLETVAAYLPPDIFQANGITGVYDAFVFAQGGLGYASVAIFLFASAHSMRRHESAPAWLGALGYAAAGGASIATLSIFFAYGPMAPGGPAPGIVGALPAAVWLVATGIVLIQSKRGSAPASTSGAS